MELVVAENGFGVFWSTNKLITKAKLKNKLTWRES